MHFQCRIIAALAALVLPIGASFAAQPTTYEVSATLSHSGVPFASPALRVEPGVPASVEVVGPDGYTLSLTITEGDEGSVKVSTKLDSSHGSMDPTIIVRPGEPATVSVGDLGLDLTIHRSDA
ncbi:hypothetical protein [Luteimonas sp. A501]